MAINHYITHCITLYDKAGEIESMSALKVNTAVILIYYVFSFTHVIVINFALNRNLHMETCL